LDAILTTAYDSGIAAQQIDRRFVEMFLAAM
jgi:hypothetical protein